MRLLNELGCHDRPLRLERFIPSEKLGVAFRPGFSLRSESLRSGEQTI